MPGNSLDSLFDPRSIAVIGASDRPGSVGQLVFENLRTRGFAGAVYAVNSKRAAVQGVDCYPSVRQLPKPAELAVVAVPAASVPALLEECGEAGVRAAIVLSAGFAERGAEGAQLQRDALAAAQRHGLRVLGPNCLGIVRPSKGLSAVFTRARSRPGRLALLSQSGAVCSAILDWADARGIGFSSVVSLGAAADIGFGELLDHLALDPETDAILMYAEGVDHPRRFMSGLRVAARMKPVIALKTGRRREGGRAAATHTGALVGGDAAFDSALRRAGAVRVRTLEQLFAAAEVLGRGKLARGNRLALITNAGGLGVMAADRSADLGLALAALSPATQAALDAELPADWSHANPLDLLGDAPPERYGRALELVLQDSGVDGAVVLLSPQGMTKPTAVAAAVIEASAQRKKPVLASFMGGAQVKEAHALFAARGLPHLPAPEAAVEAFGALAQFERNQRLLLQVPGPLSDASAPDLDAARAIVRGALAAGRPALSLSEGKALLRAFRIDVTPSLEARTADDARGAARRLGFPLAMKIDSPDVAHKSDVGGVRLDLRNEAEVAAAFDAVLSDAKRLRPDAALHGVTLEPMLPPSRGRELLVGVTRDPALGPVVAFSAGGVLVELLAEQNVALPPLNRLLARELIERSRVRPLLGAYRGMPALALEGLETVLLRVSELACELPELEALDINPLIAGERGFIAVDARVQLRAAAASTDRYAHLSIRPYPAELERSVRLPGGESVRVRPVRPEDAQMEQRFVQKLSLESRYFRFRQGLCQLTPLMLVRFTQLDYDREMAFVALAGDAGAEEEIGVARYVTGSDGERCEFALVVADAWQGRGLGASLMQVLIECAERSGLRAMHGEVLAENGKMLELMRFLGFSIARHPEDASLKLVERALRA